MAGDPSRTGRFKDPDAATEAMTFKIAACDRPINKFLGNSCLISNLRHGPHRFRGDGGGKKGEE